MKKWPKRSFFPKKTKSGNETHLFSGAVFNKCTIVVGQKSAPLSLPKRRLVTDWDEYD